MVSLQPMRNKSYLNCSRIIELHLKISSIMLATSVIAASLGYSA
jgi:hypothetical protein